MRVLLPQGRFRDGCAVGDGRGPRLWSRAERTPPSRPPPRRLRGWGDGVRDCGVALCVLIPPGRFHGESGVWRWAVEATARSSWQAEPWEHDVLVTVEDLGDGSLDALFEKARRTARRGRRSPSA